MDCFARCLLSIATAAILGFCMPAQAGEIVSGAASCELSATAAHPCAWKASHCKRPDIPMIYAASPAEFNRAAAMLNTYAEGLNAYMACMGKEAQADMKSAGEMVNASLEKTQSAMTADFNRSKAQLDAARLKLQLQ
jgi:hypothetical protein